MSILNSIRTQRALSHRVRDLTKTMDHMEEEMSQQIDDLQSENEYLKDELAILRTQYATLRDRKQREEAEAFPALHHMITQQQKLIDKLREEQKDTEDEEE